VVLLDLRDVTYIDSGGLSVLLSGVRRLRDRGWLGVIGPNPNVRRLLEISGAPRRSELPGLSEISAKPKTRWRSRRSITNVSLLGVAQHPHHHADPFPDRPITAAAPPKGPLGRDPLRRGLQGAHTESTACGPSTVAARPGLGVGHTETLPGPPSRGRNAVHSSTKLQVPPWSRRGHTLAGEVRAPVVKAGDRTKTSSPHRSPHNSPQMPQQTEPGHVG